MLIETCEMLHDHFGLKQYRVLDLYTTGLTIEEFGQPTSVLLSLAWPNPFCTDAYQLEIISTTLKGSGIVHRPKMNNGHLRLVSVN